MFVASSVIRHLGALPSMFSTSTGLLPREEIMEKQRSRISWLKDGHQNTKLFQERSKERVKYNQINALHSTKGMLITDH
jgi:hypothetical protein